MSSNPSGVSLECTVWDSAQRKIVRELTPAKIAASSTFNISTSREQAVHQAVLRWRLTTTHLSVSSVISVRVFMRLSFLPTRYRGLVLTMSKFDYLCSLQFFLNNLGHSVGFE
jgi:hypothetical protein